jgi:parallel beta-helix repeat protein
MKKVLKRILKVTLIIIAVLAVLLIGNKIWQHQVMDLKNPELESIQSISDFKQQNNVSGEIVLIAKDTTSFYNIINPYFGNGGIWVFDNKGNVLETNVAYSNSFGACFREIKNNIIKKNFDFSSSTIEPSFTKENYFEKLLKSTVLVNNATVVESLEYPFENYEYIIVYGWSKYYGLSYKNSQVKEIDDYIKSNNKNVLLVSVNVDYADYWYPKNEPLPIIK